MKIHVARMRESGSELVLVDNASSGQPLAQDHLGWITDQQCGAGTDYVLVVERAGCGEADFRCRFYNYDGSEGQACGNWEASFARFVGAGKAVGKSLKVETRPGDIVRITADGEGVAVDLGEPEFEHSKIPFCPGEASHLTRHADTLWGIRSGGENCWISALSLREPYAVLVVGDARAARVQEIGAAMEQAPEFPKGVNVGFLQPVSRSAALLRVWACGDGEVAACRQAAGAAAAAGIRRGLLDGEVEIRMPGATHRIRWNGEEKRAPVFYFGVAETVFDGEIELPGHL